MLFAVLALAHLVINFVLTPNTPFPFHPDDFSFLAGGMQDLGWHWKRPVSSNLVFLIAEFGPALSYFVLNLSAVLVAWLVLLLLRDVFGVGLGAVSAAIFGAVLFSHAGTFVHSKYLGLITNLASHGFGLASLLLLWHGWRYARAWQCGLAAASFLLSAFAKEDFLLPPLLLLGLLWAMGWKSRGTGEIFRGPWRWRAVLVSLVFLTIAAGSMAWNYYDRNPFIAGLFSHTSSSAPYAVDLSPSSLLRAFRVLFLEYTPVATVLAAIACTGLWMAAPALRLRLFWFVATVIVLAAPYAMIPNNMPGYRAYAWLPWMAAILVVALRLWRERMPVDASRLHAMAPAAVALAVVALSAWMNQEARLSLADRYARGEVVNRHMLQTLDNHRNVLDHEAVIGLHGLEGPSPWCGNGPVYLSRKRGYRQRWIVFAPNESTCYQNPSPGGRKPRHDLGLSVVAPHRVCESPSLWILVFDAQGHGRLVRGRELCATGGG